MMILRLVPFFRCFSIFVALSILPGLLLGQTKVDIGLLSTSQTNYDLLLYSDHDFDGIVSGLVFTIELASGAIADDIVVTQETSIRSVLPIALSRVFRSDYGTTYYVFYAVGLRSLSDAGVQLQRGMSQKIASITCSGTSMISLSTDPWTLDRKNNARYFLSLSGHDRTGKVLNCGTAEDADLLGGVSISPVPYSAGPLTFEWDGDFHSSMMLSVVDMAGRVVFTQPVAVSPAEHSYVLSSMPHLAYGQYTAVLTSDKLTRTGQFIVVPSP